MTSTPAVRRSTSTERALKLFVVLQRCAGALLDGFREHEDLAGLTLTEFEILEALFHKGPLLLGDVQKKILLSSGGVTYTIDRLVEKGLVERRECTTDRRARYAALTPAGEALVGTMFPTIAAHIEQTMSVLTAREQQEAVDVLRRLGLSAAEK